MLTPPFSDWPKIPYVGVGCIVTHEGRLLLVRNKRGLWSTPGGHLEYGETPEACAARETLEETGIAVTNVEFVAITNDVLKDAGKHYVTIWMRADPAGTDAAVADPDEIDGLGWFDPAVLPENLHVYLRNLIGGNCMPAGAGLLPARD